MCCNNSDTLFTAAALLLLFRLPTKTMAAVFILKKKLLLPSKGLSTWAKNDHRAAFCKKGLGCILGQGYFLTVLPATEDL